MRNIIIFLIMIFSSLAKADDLFPRGCLPLSVKGNSIHFKNKGVYLVANISDNDLWLVHPVKNPGASAGWTSKVRSKHWSAILLNQGFLLNCIESVPGHEQKTPCQGLVKLCKFKKIELPKTSGGSFWVGEDLPLPKLLEHIQQRGFSMNSGIN